MHKILEKLVSLQEIDAKLQNLEIGKGDLPAKVQTLSAEIIRLQDLLAVKNIACAGYHAEFAQVGNEIALHEERLKKYRVQLYAVKTNKEYDAMTSEIETAEKKVDDLKFRKLELEELIEQVEGEIQTLTEKIREHETILSGLQHELQQKLLITHEEESELSSRRQKLVQEVPKQILSTYERIRQARGGYAVAELQNNACSHCSSRIPSQRGLEIRMMNKLNLCEVCGRILVWRAEQTQSL
ncbi:MAG: hypothetical protein EHM72_14915 [Calditrichaeota bacterium]|nr:MAG: hypothetical protein EHM72_14915 [Calditrichota bacterium]